MKKSILFITPVFSVLVWIIGCQKSSAPSAAELEASINPVTLINVIHATDSGTVVNVSVSKTGYTAIVQKNNTRDNSSIDSIKFRYEDVTGKFFPVGSTTLDSTNNTLIDSLVLVSPTAIAVTSVADYPGLSTQYFNITVDDSLFITGKTYTLIASVYTANGNSQTVTYASLIKW
jgi:hypothetical protein